MIYFIQFNIKQTMQAAQIRDKYKRILEEPEEEDSEDQWEQAYAQMAKHRKQRILTEASQASTNSQNNNNEGAVLSLKQKLAQCLSNCKLHCRQIERLKREHGKFEEEREDWREREGELNKAIEDERAGANVHLERVKQLENQLQEMGIKYQQVFMDRDLQQKQVDYYKSEINQLKDELERKEKQFRQCQKEFRSFDKTKKENDYLRTDVERLSALIEDSVRFGKVSGQILRKHFLGKPHRQMEFWYPQQLVGEVQHFLKKNQVGYGNRQFTSNLVKFIQKINQKAGKEETKLKHGAASCKREKEAQSLKKSTKINLFELSNKKHSYNLGSMREQCILRSNTNSFWKSNESRIVPSYSTNLTNLGLVAVKSQCWDIINEFRTIVFELLLEKEVKRKKIKRLLDSMINSMMEMFDGCGQGKQFSFNPDKKDQMLGFRISTEEAPTLK